MYKRLLRCVREYKAPTLLTLLFITLEAVIECYIPFVAAQLINDVRNGAQMNTVVRSGLILIAMAVVSLCCGGIPLRFRQIPRVREYWHIPQE